jgi:hypothetical protein
MPAPPPSPVSRILPALAARTRPLLVRRKLARALPACPALFRAVALLALLALALPAALVLTLSPVQARAAVLSVPPAQSPVPLAPYSMLLRQYVQNGSVDYAGLKAEAKRLDTYLNFLAHVEPAALSEPDQKAFYVNLYNAWTLKLVLTRYPKISSIKETGTLLKSPWKTPLVRLGGQTLTLDEVENGILRARFKDPLVHFALNCASRSCPPLRAEPYEGSRLEDQFADQARAFLNDPTRNRVEGDTLYLSRIFDWYAKDFGGPRGVLAFLRRYAGPELKAGLDRLGPEPRIQYLDYDWSLNGR